MVIYNATQLAREFQHPLVTITLAWAPTLQFIPFPDDLHIGYAMVAIHPLFILVEDNLPEVFYSSILINLSSCIFTEIKSALRVALTVLFAVFLVV